jgi:hypothetical protein
MGTIIKKDQEIHQKTTLAISKQTIPKPLQKILFVGIKKTTSKKEFNTASKV